MSEDKICKDGKRFRIKDIISIEIEFSMNEFFWIEKKAKGNKKSFKQYIKQKVLEEYNG